MTASSSTTVAIGSVISTSPAAATLVNIGSAVNLLVSTGPAPAVDVTGQVTVTRGALIFNRTTNRYTQSITLSNSGGALSATAYVLDNLANGYAVYQPTGLTAASIPLGSPFREVGPIGTGASITFAIEMTRAGTPTLTYTPRILGLGAR